MGKAGPHRDQLTSKALGSVGRSEDSGSSPHSSTPKLSASIRLEESHRTSAKPPDVLQSVGPATCHVCTSEWKVAMARGMSTALVIRTYSLSSRLPLVADPDTLV